MRERSTVDDMLEVMAYYKIEAEDRAYRLFEEKMAELDKKKASATPKTLGAR